jgi:hypothetical protein
MMITSDLFNLEEALRELIWPVFVREGFSFNNSEKAEGSRIYNFDKTVGGERLVAAITIKKNKRPTFQIIAGRVPQNGVKIFCPEENIPADKVTAHMLSEQSFLCPYRHAKASPCFFPSLLQVLIGHEKAVRKIVGRAADRLPELLSHLERGVESKFVWTYQFYRPPPQL